jgi:hypothetical protein
VGDSNWDAMLQSWPSGDYLYANLINGLQTGFLGTVFLPMDILDDRVAPFSTQHGYSPFSDVELMDANNRMLWYGFYRKLASGDVQYAVAICKQRRNEIFAEQAIDPDVAIELSYANPLATSGLRRLPVPWRVTVAYDAQTGILWKPNPTGASALAALAPVGSKIMVQGAVYSVMPTLPTVPAGRILTVSDALGPESLRVIGDVDGFPGNSRLDPGDDTYFDIWVFPPSLVTYTAPSQHSTVRGSPLLEWKFLP